MDGSNFPEARSRLLARSNSRFAQHRALLNECKGLYTSRLKPPHNWQSAYRFSNLAYTALAAIRGRGLRLSEASNHSLPTEWTAANSCLLAHPLSSFVLDAYEPVPIDRPSNCPRRVDAGGTGAGIARRIEGRKGPIGSTQEAVAIEVRVIIPSRDLPF